MSSAPTASPLDLSTDIAIVGAGPVGLMIANYLGQCGVNVTLVEKLDSLIDYPRAIGLDDESLRTFQAVGLADNVLPHTTPWHAMRFMTPKGRCFADIQPKTDEFGWSRRNAFIQPLADRVLFEGLQRFDNVKVLFGRELEGFEQSDSGVQLTLKNAEGRSERLQAKYLIGCDGGNSLVRRSLDISFEGKTAPNQWIVVDIANDPLSTPHVYLCCDPVRPYVSAALPHGVRRFEFMVMPGETEAELSKPENMRKLLAKVLPDPDRIELIRSRVYTHNARLAGRFRQGRVLLAGDAAHIMPVWQGQGYNSGMRDASNLAWKLSLVIKGLASDRLLDSYELERRDHAKAMIDLSVLAGHVLAPPKRWQGTLRDGVSWLLNYVPPVKRYFVEMRFKPMPQYTRGALIVPSEKGSPVGKMFIQPKVLTDAGATVLLDEVIGENFAIIAWGCDPTWGLTAAQIAQWKTLGTRFIQVLPDVQLRAPSDAGNDVIRVGDSTGRLREWFARGSSSIALLRPDRFLAGLATPQTLGKACNELALALNAQPHIQVTPAVSKVA
ncbi:MULTISPECIES: bifunctional 3-(3-hydroxy-phenyl)propionate/3-hydroxycinnamic acid hydroxylase [unclassified Pseudomonas]|uniref:bifunctional 3-(3-hydroxy-phenyl)propionate/3-hydroxycinnamic acid hydroxylase n=1 Tax=unclassified Pseudomonas TaxID=196821 RepID=UPI001054CFEC|nr:MULTISPECIES: bifunctional 3-(3-hydroxy-phenyl)propionate/3-hydroxycinnamic acid hydroxylase [unclassified Pseudomonas]MBW3503433.1 bifunctional 3-(3-hydroxy-phenyl)propionate/3-hydroxycinnamic acid hydroxylase [Pseudomonas sp. NKUCC02_KPG]MEC4167384.1 bifunctional 3-(3-hydroxy-phenyl)propionate/3-hydroxycinnamic acid hydroxylase [Pseudomonas sp. MS-1(2024)]MEC4240130.1 bifunctional 3-(3-hydroxy-phenyl)propionate/3-hydroxycinnamic acid hydroxylase [Pseudomonas sp. DSV-1]